MHEAAVRVLQVRMKLSGSDAVSGKCNDYMLRVGVPG